MGEAPIPQQVEEPSRDAVLDALRRRILACARRRLGDADAEDVTGEVLRLLSTKYGEVADPTALVALALGLLRRKRTGEGPTPDRVALDGERLALLIAATAGLGGRCREILRRKLEGASLVEIAWELRRPVNVVYGWDWRCQRRLKAILGERWAFVSGGEDE
jgi:DNA-directed RNA polymerase specialized sigma24 family protein